MFFILPIGGLGQSNITGRRVVHVHSNRGEGSKDVGGEGNKGVGNDGVAIFVQAEHQSGEGVAIVVQAEHQRDEGVAIVVQVEHQSGEGNGGVGMSEPSKHSTISPLY